MAEPEAPIRVVAITGAPGAGKSTVGRRLVERCPDGSVWVDTDHLAGVHPWVVNDSLYDLIAANLAACLHNFREWGAPRIVVSGVIVPEGTYSRLGPQLTDPAFDWQFYGLSVDPDELVRRIRLDPGPQDPEQRLAWTRLNDVLSEIPGCRILDTSGLELDEVVDALAAVDEGARLAEADA